MKICYLGCKKDTNYKYEIDYYDIEPGENVKIKDMAKVNLEEYDLIICTPPCNYWSQANYRRETSEYAQKTKLLLPLMYYKCVNSGKLYLIENVYKACCKEYMPKYDFKHGRHIYWSNIEGLKENLPGEEVNGSSSAYEVWKHLNSKTRDGDKNVHKVIERAIENGLRISDKN